MGSFEVFAAEREGQVVSFIVVNMNNCDDNIGNIVVDREKQGNGIGRSLVRYVEKIAKSRGFCVLKTDTTENAKGVPWIAYRFWKKIGYEDTGERIRTEYGFKVIPLNKNLK